MNEKDNKKVSVILIAFNRKNFVFDALYSVFNQTIDHSRIEMIIISNFEIAINNIPNGISVKCVIQDGSIGEYLYKGITMAQNEIIAFIEDDDIWRDDRLEEILRIFTSSREVIYYHNSQWYIDSCRNVIAPLFQNPARSNGTCYKIKPRSYRDISRLINLAAGFNLSSIAISKSAFTNSLSSLRSITGNPDGFFFWKAIMLSKEIYNDSRRLTGYRMHDQNLSLSRNQTEKGDEILRQMATFRILQKDFEQDLTETRGTTIDNYIELQCVEWKVQYLLISGKKKQVVFSYLIKILKLINFRLVDLMTLRLLIFLLAYIVNFKLFSVVMNKISINAYYSKD